MIRSLSTFLTEDLRRDRRHKLRLPCRLVLDGSEIAATVIEISLGGARIELPPKSVTVMPGAIRALHLGETGGLRARERWRRGNVIGVGFRGRDARLRVAAFFEELALDDDEEPKISPDG